MKPRMGSALGCPYGQEIEFLDSGLSLWGTDFFWTMGQAVAEFNVTEKAMAHATKEWTRVLASGELSQEQARLASTTNAAGFVEVLEKATARSSAGSAGG